MDLVKDTVTLDETSRVIETMMSEENTAYGPRGVCAVVGRELAERTGDAERAGVDPWRLWLDPGIGFAKGHDDNLRLLDGSGEVRLELAARGGLRHAPLLVGMSRKGFLGRLTGRAVAADRDFATAAAVAAAVRAGADVVRVHCAEAGADAARVADALYR